MVLPMNIDIAYCQIVKRHSVKNVKTISQTCGVTVCAWIGWKLLKTCDVHGLTASTGGKCGGYFNLLSPPFQNGEFFPYWKFRVKSRPFDISFFDNDFWHNAVSFKCDAARMSGYQIRSQIKKTQASFVIRVCKGERKVVLEYIMFLQQAFVFILLRKQVPSCAVRSAQSTLWHNTSCHIKANVVRPSRSLPKGTSL